jgi:hypothetical protein
MIDQMQAIVYQEAPYHILYYPSQLDANRTDRFAGWKNQPSTQGNPLFGYGSLNYTYLTDATAPAPSPSSAQAPSAGTSAAPVASPPASTGNGQSTSGTSPLLILGIGALVVVLAVGFLVLRRGRGVTEEE